MVNALDYLARHVHEFEKGRTHVTLSRDVYFYSRKPDGVESFTRQQWADRRAELQNKPSWQELPSEARYICQESNGEWGAWADRPHWAVETREVWRGDEPLDSWNLANATRHTGEVLGDWRDTLEQRPELQARAPVVMGEEKAPVAEFEPFTSMGDAQPFTRKQALQWAVENVEEWHMPIDETMAFWPCCTGWSWTQMAGNIYLVGANQQPCIGETEWYKACEAKELEPAAGRNCRCVSKPLHTIHHAAFLHKDCQLLLSEPELAVFRTADGELIHCKPKECLIDPDVCGLAARLLADMSGYPVAPEHMRELAEQMGWSV